MPHSPPAYSPRAGITRYAKDQDNPRARQARRQYRTNSKQHRALRTRTMAINPYCPDCKPQLVRGSEMDHADGNDANNDDSNLRMMCKSHHSRKTAKHDGGFGNARRKP